MKIEEFKILCQKNENLATKFLKELFENRNQKYFYHFVFIYIELIDEFDESLSSEIIKFCSNIFRFVDMKFINPSLTGSKIIKNILYYISSTFLGSFDDRLQLYDIIDNDIVTKWLEDEIVDYININNIMEDKYIKFFYNKCRHLLPLYISLDLTLDYDKIIGFDKNEINCNFLKDHSEEEFYQMIRNKNKEKYKDIKFNTEENILSNSIYDYGVIVKSEVNGVFYPITPAEFHFCIKNKKNFYTNTQLDEHTMWLINISCLYLYPYFGTIEENIKTFIS